MSPESAQYVANRQGLTSHGNVNLRNAAVDIIDHGISRADPYLAVKRLLQLHGDVLQVGDLEFELHKYDRIFIIGTGKASPGIAKALEEVLGYRITDGLFIFGYGTRLDLNHSRVIYASHPYPDGNSYRGGQSMLELAKTFTAGDLVIAGITGGSSALMELPVEAVPFEDIQKTYKLLLLSGADIVEINTVRKHLSRIKGGLLATEIFPATLINLTVSDVIGDMLDYITCPTVTDTSTFEDARRIMELYKLWDKVPASVKDYLRKGGPAQETPKDFGDQPVHSFVVVPGDAACLGSYERAMELGFKGMFLTSMLKGEAKDAGTLFASIAREVVINSRPLVPPCAVIAGGENVVTLEAETTGHGGPNQEFALSASLEIDGYDRIAIASIDTDGIDGIADAAGGLVDGTTRAALNKCGIDPRIALKRHDSYSVLHRVGDTVITGFTGTNVNDLKLLLVE
jgi:glycerate-2-kinase